MHGGRLCAVRAAPARRTSACKIGVNGAGDTPASSVQKAPWAMCTLWCESRDTKMWSMAIGCLRIRADIFFESSVAPATASEPPSWKSFCGSMMKSAAALVGSLTGGQPSSTAAPPIAAPTGPCVCAFGGMPLPLSVTPSLAADDWAHPMAR